MSINEEIQERAIRHALAIAAYDRSLSAKIVRLLNSADKDIVERLAARLVTIKERGFDTGPATTKALSKLLEEVRALNAAVYADVESALTDELIEFSAAEATFQKAALDRAIGVELGTALPNPRRLRAIVTETPIQGTLLKPWVEGMASNRMQRIEQQLRLGMVEGETTDQIAARIRGTRAKKYQDGILNISRNSAQTMVRTAVSHVSNVSAQETWKANSHIVKGWQFLATLDSRTSDKCASNDGKFFLLGEGPIPPLHPRCRSVSLPITKSFKEMGIKSDELPASKRASMDGQVPDSVRYSDWLTKQSLSVQEKVLGKNRANLFNEGKLSWADLVNGNGELLSLEELRERYPSILD